MLENSDELFSTTSKLEPVNPPDDGITFGPVYFTVGNGDRAVEVVGNVSVGVIASSVFDVVVGAVVADPGVQDC